MADSTVTVSIAGLDELNARLHEEAPKVAKKVLRLAGRRGGEIIRSAIAQAAPRDTGFLEEHIVMKTTVRDTGMTVVIWPQGDAGYFKGAERHGNKVEFKGSPHYAAVAARMAEFGSKHEAAQPFIGPAFDGSADEALDVFVDELWNGLQDLAEK
jgi:HK97 gp10 family phage protein